VRPLVRGARHFTELVVWQLADELRIQILTLTSRSPFLRDGRLRSQTEDAINSVCRNIAEGFGCRSHLEFARFLDISRRSLNEVQDALRGAQLKGYLTAADLEPVATLCRRFYPALGRLIAYL
jgi:four helix bundle protein